MPRKDEIDIAYEATVDAIARTRRVLIVVSSVIAMGYFYLFHWYAAWDLARIDARKGVAAALAEKNSAHVYVTGPRSDSIIRVQMLADIDRMEGEWAGRKIGMPILGLQVSAADFSVAILIIAAAALLWLLFYQRRLAWCLNRLDRLDGWGLPVSVLEYHFVLIGSHSTRTMRFAARCLLWGLPVLGLGFLLSDGVDLYQILGNPVRKLAFENPVYLRRVVVRLTMDFFLVLVIAVLGYLCQRAYSRTEDELLSLTPRDPGDATPRNGDARG